MELRDPVRLSMNTLIDSKAFFKVTIPSRFHLCPGTLGSRSAKAHRPRDWKCPFFVIHFVLQEKEEKMAVSVRLDKKIELLLKETSSLLRTSKAEVIKRSLSEYCPKILKERRKHPYELIKDLLEKGGSGRGDLSMRAEEIFRERLGRKP